jgi:hypothetical protein
MLIQKIVRPESIVARQRLVAEFCNKIGQKRKGSRRANIFRNASESGSEKVTGITPPMRS